VGAAGPGYGSRSGTDLSADADCRGVHRVIGECGLAETAVDEATAVELYRDMVRAREFDERAVALQRRGWMSGYPPFRGQEASQVGTAHALAARDWLAPTYRSNALQIARGVPMSDVLLFRRGHPEFHSDHDLPHLPQAVPIATQVPHAVGVGMALNYRRGDLVSDAEEDTGGDGAGDADDRRPRSALDTRDTPAAIGPDAPPADRTAVLCYLGDGATSEGDFHEGLNFAGVFDAPVLFLCENNGWAISLPRERQTASATLAGKASAYGFDGGRVDGNDPIAVFEFVRAALETARSGEPVLVESLTYRMGAHTTSDDPSRYREEPDLPEWRTRDPLERYEEYLREEGVVDDETVAAAATAAAEELDAAIEAAEAVPDPPASAVFDPVYAALTPRVRRQRAETLDRHPGENQSSET